MNKVLSSILVTVASLALGVSLWSVHLATALNPNLGGTVENFPSWFTNGLSVGNNSNGNTGVFTNAVAGQIGPGANTAHWTNNTGHTVFIPLVVLHTTGTASSSMKLIVSASTTVPALADDFNALNLPMNDVAISTIVATSSTATTTSNLLSVAQNSSKSSGVISVAAGSSLNIVMHNASGVANAPLNTCNGASCETATSTNRGFNVNWYFEYLF